MLNRSACRIGMLLDSACWKSACPWMEPWGVWVYGYAESVLYACLEERT